MPYVTPARIAALSPHISTSIAEALAPILESEMPAFGIQSVLRRAHFLAQACHETQGFTRFEENLHYTSPARLDAMFSAVHGEVDAAALIQQGPEAIANRVYADRNGNGGEGTGDGWAFRGRGCFQLTGRANYTAASKALGRDFVGQPDLVAQPEGAVLTALWFWMQHGCNAPADRDDVLAVTRIINGPAVDGLADRRALTERAKTIFI